MRLTLFAAALCVSSLAAHADTFQYTFTSTQSDPNFAFINYTFTTSTVNQVQSKTTLSPSQYTLVDNPGAFNGGTIANIILDDTGGAITLVFSGMGGTDSSLSTYSLQQYGTPGTYTELFTNTNGFGNNETDTLVVNRIAVSPSSVTPEPSSFALLGTGLLGVAGILKRRFA